MVYTDQLLSSSINLSSSSSASHLSGKVDNSSYLDKVTYNTESPKTDNNSTTLHKRYSILHRDSKDNLYTMGPLDGSSSSRRTLLEEEGYIDDEGSTSPNASTAYSHSKLYSTNTYPRLGNGLSLRIGIKQLCILLSFIITTSLVILYKPNLISDLKNNTSTSFILPSSWQTPSKLSSIIIPPEIESGLKDLIPSERELVLTQYEYKANVDNYFNPKPNWGHGPGREDYKFYTESELRKLAVCTATNTCRENQTSVIIIGHIFAHFHLYEGYMGGEGIWFSSMIETLTKWGYTILRARDDWVYMWYIYNQIPDMVKGIIAAPTGQYGTFEDQMKTSGRGNGIPAWKFFVYNYFPDHYSSVVGDAWNMHSELGFSHQQRNFTFINYVVEPARTPPYVPTSKRPNQVYILAKFLRYFYPGTQPAWEDRGIFLRAKTILEKEFEGFEFVIGCKDDRNEKTKLETPMELPTGIRNLGTMDKFEFERQLASSKVMLGIGWPTLSPSPHIALSLGIPFISPYGLWGHSKVEDPDTWSQSQHNTLKALNEPYVYHVLRNDEEQFIDAIRKALKNPIEPYRLPFMTREHHEQAVSDWLNTDWESKAEKILENRKKGIETENGNELKVFTM
ncbi:uncharacterized protein L201_006887 [Kwoniella dendrophila CBS 6074]|uniref:Glycosyltransferase family 18 catalytic domain-containing protein n=1 Tax=Kwoniella dendrophila CBS 6074 TaxID=1295534 RepID=A0AAX4K566_9TREE